MGTQINMNGRILFKFISRVSYANLGIEKDPPYVYKDRVSNYDAPIENQRVK
jgi:hypothetical protein